MELVYDSKSFVIILVALLVLLQLSSSQELEGLEIRVGPSSILVPINNNVEFECEAYCTERCAIVWFIDGGTTAHPHQRQDYKQRGYMFPSSQSDNPSSGVVTSRLLATTSIDINNTNVSCEVDNDSHQIMSNNATLLVITEPLVSPNPLIVTLPESITLKWSPPYLWTGHRIGYYNVSTTNTTDGTVTYERINATFNNPLVTHDISRQYQECTDFIFGISAVSTTGEILQTYEAMGGYQQVPMDFDMSAFSANVLFFANITPIVRMKVKLPSMICDYQEVNYTIIVDTINDTNIIKLGPFYHLGSGMVQHDLVSTRLVRDEEYSVKVILFTYSHTVTSHNHSFNTTFMAQIDSFPPVCTDAVSNRDHGIRNYNLLLGICAGVTFAILSLAILVISIGAFLKWKLHQKRKTTDTSAERACNSMVPNPIYSGPLYESVQPRFETLTSVTASSSGEQQCSSRASTPSSSEKSVRYVDPPSHSPKNRSKSFASSGPSHSSMLISDTSNIARSTSVSIPAIKKSGKQRNKLNLTLTLTGTDSTGTTGVQNSQSSISEPISAVNPVVLMDVDDNYTVMSPVAGRSVLAGMAEWSELSPEDTDKYRE